MKIGKVPENVLKRSVINQICTKREEVLLGAGVGEDCAALQLEPDEVMVLSTDPITGTVNDIGKLAINITVNDIASAGAQPIGVMLTILLPDGTEEAQLKQMMQQMQEECRISNIQIIGGHTEVTGAVNQPIISVTGVGKVKKGQLVETRGAKVGDDIVVSKWIGLEGTSIIANQKQKELKERFSIDFIEKAKAFDQYLSVLPESRIAVAHGVSAMHDVTEGGIFGALWEMAEASDIGLEIFLKKIPVKQETIEICEFFGINPYELISSGCMLIAAKDGTGLVHELEKAGIYAVLIGKATKGKDRLLFNEEEKRFLEPPKADELYKVI
jgi:hydrogenase expression/formation protein HypE